MLSEKQVLNGKQLLKCKQQKNQNNVLVSETTFSTIPQACEFSRFYQNPGFLIFVPRKSISDIHIKTRRKLKGRGT